MLVLSRKIGERLVIGDNITLVINRIAGNRVTIGIEAPSDVRVVRGELGETSEATAASTAAKPGLAAKVFERMNDSRNASIPRLAK